MSGGHGKRKKVGRWIAAAAAGLFLYFFLSGPEGLIAVYQSHRKLRTARAEIKALHAEIDSLTREIRDLRSDTAYLDRIARQRLGMARKDERVYKFIEEK